MYLIGSVFNYLKRRNKQGGKKACYTLNTAMLSCNANYPPCALTTHPDARHPPPQPEHRQRKQGSTAGHHWQAKQTGDSLEHRGRILYYTTTAHYRGADEDRPGALWFCV